MTTDDDGTELLTILSKDLALSVRNWNGAQEKQMVKMVAILYLLYKAYVNDCNNWIRSPRRTLAYSTGFRDFTFIGNPLRVSVVTWVEGVYNVKLRRPMKDILRLVKKNK